MPPDCEDEQEFKAAPNQIGAPQEAPCCNTETIRKIPDELKEPIGHLEPEPPTYTPGSVPIGNREVTVTCEDPRSYGDPVHYPANYRVRQIYFSVVLDIADEVLEYIAKNALEQTIANAFADGELTPKKLRKMTGMTLKQAKAFLEAAQDVQDTLTAIVRDKAISELECYWLNDPQTASCADDAMAKDEEYEDVIFTATVPAKKYKSYESQEDADAMALAEAQSLINCLYINDEFIAKCEERPDRPMEIMDPVPNDEKPIYKGRSLRVGTVVVPVGKFTSKRSKEEANEKARAWGYAQLVCWYPNLPVHAECDDENARDLNVDPAHTSGHKADLDTNTPGQWVDVPYGYIMSDLSIEDATQEAEAMVEPLLRCCFINKELVLKCDPELVTRPIVGLASDEIWVASVQPPSGGDTEFIRWRHMYCGYTDKNGNKFNHLVWAIEARDLQREPNGAPLKDENGNPLYTEWRLANRSDIARHDLDYNGEQLPLVGDYEEPQIICDDDETYIDRKNGQLVYGHRNRYVFGTLTLWREAPVGYENDPKKWIWIATCRGEDRASFQLTTVYADPAPYPESPRPEIVVPAGAFTSCTSQEEADEFARTSVEGLLQCKYCNETIVPTCIPSWVLKGIEDGVIPLPLQEGLIDYTDRDTGIRYRAHTSEFPRNATRGAPSCMVSASTAVEAQQIADLLAKMPIAGSGVTNEEAVKESCTYYNDTVVVACAADDPFQPESPQPVTNMGEWRVKPDTGEPYYFYSMYPEDTCLFKGLTNPSPGSVMIVEAGMYADQGSDKKQALNTKAIAWGLSMLQCWFTNPQIEARCIATDEKYKDTDANGATLCDDVWYYNGSMEDAEVTLTELPDPTDDPEDFYIPEEERNTPPSEAQREATYKKKVWKPEWTPDYGTASKYLTSFSNTEDRPSVVPPGHILVQGGGDDVASITQSIFGKGIAMAAGQMTCFYGNVSQYCDECVQDPLLYNGKKGGGDDICVYGYHIHQSVPAYAPPFLMVAPTVQEANDMAVSLVRSASFCYTDTWFTYCYCGEFLNPDDPILPDPIPNPIPDPDPSPSPPDPIPTPDGPIPYYQSSSPPDPSPSPGQSSEPEPSEPTSIPATPPNDGWQITAVITWNTIGGKCCVSGIEDVTLSVPGYTVENVQIIDGMGRCYDSGEAVTVKIRYAVYSSSTHRLIACCLEAEITTNADQYCGHSSPAISSQSSPDQSPGQSPPPQSSPVQSSPASSKNDCFPNCPNYGDGTPSGNPAQDTSGITEKFSLWENDIAAQYEQLQMSLSNLQSQLRKLTAQL